MIGVQDFIGYYDWTFEYLRRNFGEQAVADYWVRAISQDSQTHARELIVGKGFDGMYEYWAHTLEMEEAGYTFDRGEDYFRIDMFDCPSKGHLIKRGLAAYHDYCEHCMGWIKPLMDDAGFVIDHEHNHAGQCWWEMHRSVRPTPTAPHQTAPPQRRPAAKPGTEPTQLPPPPPDPTEMDFPAPNPPTPHNAARHTPPIDPQPATPAPKQPKQSHKNRTQNTSAAKNRHRPTPAATSLSCHARKPWLASWR